MRSKIRSLPTKDSTLRLSRSAKRRVNINFSCITEIIYLSSAINAQTKKGEVRAVRARMNTSQSVGEGYSRKQVLRMLGLSNRQLAAWERQGLVSPQSGAPAAETGNFGTTSPEKPPLTDGEPPEGVYTFSDLVSLRTLLQLRKEGVPPARLRSLHAVLKEKLGGVEKPWSELQVRKRGKRLLVHFQGMPLEPMTGQLLLEYTPKDSTTAVRKLEKPARVGGPGETDGKVLADRFFRAGLRYEERKDTLPKAIRAYQKMERELDLPPLGEQAV